MIFPQGNNGDADPLAAPFVALIDALSLPILLVDSRPHILHANSGARSFFDGLRRDDALAFAIRAPNVLDAVDIALRSGERQSTLWRDRTPVERIFEISISPFATGGKTLALLELHEVTEAHRVERMRVNFIANASHELRTPLTSLAGFIETLQGPARNDAAAREKFLSIMGEQTRRMARLVDDLLSLSRIELNEHLRPQTQVNLTPIVRRIVDALEPLASGAGASISVEAPPEANVLGSADELERVVENLVENAIKYGARETGAALRVDVSIREISGDIELAVADNGPGIASEHLPRITERFYRVDAPASRARGGTGLGLAIVKHIAMRHRARLHVESQPGVGSTFKLVFKKNEIHL